MITRFAEETFFGFSQFGGFQHANSPISPRPAPQSATQTDKSNLADLDRLFFTFEWIFYVFFKKALEYFIFFG